MNLSRRLINLVESILEAQYNGEYYFSTKHKDRTPRYTYIDTVTFTNKDGSKFELEQIKLERNLLSNYRKEIVDSYANMPDYNYIFKIPNDRPLRLLNLADSNEVNRAIQQGMIHDPKHPNKNDDWNFRTDKLIKDCELFFSKFEGYIEENKYIKLFLEQEDLDELIEESELVDGNAVRFKPGSEDGIYTMPDDVLKAIKDYTAIYNTKLKKIAKDWLSKNFKPPYNEVTVYRGSGINLDNLGKDRDDVTATDILEALSKFYGIKSFDDLKSGTKVNLKRGKESSWSHKPQIAQSFSRGSSERDINILVKATVPANKVLIDFNCLDDVFLEDNFTHFSQNEVIVSGGAIPGIISNIHYSKRMIEFSKNNGIMLNN